MNMWLNAVCKTGVFILCAQILIQCRPDSSYEKYLKMLVSAMILMQLFVPLLHLFTVADFPFDGYGTDWLWGSIQKGEDRQIAAAQGDVAPESSEAEEEDGQRIYIHPLEKVPEVDRITIEPIGAGLEEDNGTNGLAQTEKKVLSTR